MSKFLLHEGASVKCAHGGQAKPTVTSQRVTVSGQPIVMKRQPYTISGCPSYYSCVTAQWIKAATRITSEGMPVLLFDSEAICTPNGTGVVILSTQTKVTGI